MVAGARTRQSGGAICGMFDHMAVLPKSADDVFGSFAIVFNNQDAHCRCSDWAVCRG